MKSSKNTSSVSDSTAAYNNTRSPYVSFRNDFEEEGEDDDHSHSERDHPIAPMISGRRSGGDGEIELVPNSFSAEKGTSSGSNCVGEASQVPLQPKRVRLRAVESERDYFLKLMNVAVLRVLVIVQVAASVVILVSQLILYSIPSEYHDRKMFNIIGIGIWAPILFFAPTIWLTYLTLRSPSGCSIGGAMACHIVSAVVGLILILFSIVHLSQHGQRPYWRHGVDGEDYNPEVPAKIFTSFLILGAVCVTVASLIASIQYCRITCCGRANPDEPLLYDIEIVKV